MNSGYFDEEHEHFHELSANNSVTMIEQQEALEAALNEGITLSNAAYMCNRSGNYSGAVENYLQAIQIKLRAYGENSVQLCISLSGLADAYLNLGDLLNAHMQATRMMNIAKQVNSREQMRIAVEILQDIATARSDSK